MNTSRLLSSMTYTKLQYSKCILRRTKTNVSKVTTVTKNRSPKDSPVREPGLQVPDLSSPNGTQRLSIEETISALKLGHCVNYYIFNKQVADKVAKMVLDHREHPKAPILEIQAGSGLVSQAFLNHGVRKVIALEKHHVFKPHLEAVKSNNDPERFAFYEWGMMNIFKKLRASEDPAAQDYKLVESLVEKNLQDSNQSHGQVQPFSLFALGGKNNNFDLLRYIAKNIPMEDALISAQGVDFFLLVNPSTKQEFEVLRGGTMNAHMSKVKHLVKMHHLLYDVEFIGEVDVSDLWGISLKQQTKSKLDERKRYLAKVKLKKDIDNILPFHQHMPFYHFMTQLHKKSSHRVIPKLESLVPGSGIRALAEGFSMTDILKTTHPKRILHLYKKMCEWPEYASCSLNQHITFETTGSIDDSHDDKEDEDEEDEN